MWLILWAHTGAIECIVLRIVVYGNNIYIAPLFSAAYQPEGPTAVQVSATAVRVSWTAPYYPVNSAPSGYRIYYQAEGDQTFTTVDTGQEDTEYLLTDLEPDTTYNIRMVTLPPDKWLPSQFKIFEPITIGKQIDVAPVHQTNLWPGTTYDIRIVTLPSPSKWLPSDLEPIAISKQIDVAPAHHTVMAKHVPLLLRPRAINTILGLVIFPRVLMSVRSLFQ